MVSVSFLLAVPRQRLIQKFFLLLILSLYTVSFVEAASWVYVSESLYPPDSNSFNTVELNCTLTNGTTSECIEVESTQGENEAITTTSFSGQVVPFTVITGPIPTQTQKSAAVTIVGNPIFNSVLNLLGIFFVLGILLSS